MRFQCDVFGDEFVFIDRFSLLGGAAPPAMWRLRGSGNRGEDKVARMGAVSPVVAEWHRQGIRKQFGADVPSVPARRRGLQSLRDEVQGRGIKAGDSGAVPEDCFADAKRRVQVRFQEFPPREYDGCRWPDRARREPRTSATVRGPPFTNGQDRFLRRLCSGGAPTGPVFGLGARARALSDPGPVALFSLTDCEGVEPFAGEHGRLRLKRDATVTPNYFAWVKVW